MLKIIRSVQELNYSQLMYVYEASNRESGHRDYPGLPAEEQLLLAEQSLYSYLRDCLSPSLDAFCAVWTCQDGYVSALRMEQYLDGYLLTALETAVEARGKGYATALVRAVLEQLRSVPVYSHIDRSNRASAIVHEKCGFQKHLDHAVLLDGSVSWKLITYRYCTQ